MFRRRIDFFSIDVIRTLLRGASSTSHAVSDFEVLFFDTLSCFASVGVQSPTDEFNFFFKSSINFPCLIATEQYAYYPGCKFNFWSHLSEERPKNFKNFMRILPVGASK